MKEFLVLDIEVLPNYFLIAFRKESTGDVLKIDMIGTNTRLLPQQKTKINNLLKKYITIGYNSNNYDMPLINYALSSARCKDIYNVSKKIVDKGMPSWMTYRDMDIKDRGYDHIDIKDPAPAVMISLKNYGTRVGSKKLQEFYLDPHTPIQSNQIEPFKEYCINDLVVTSDLFNKIKERIDLRIAMSEDYGIDLRSKSDAQIAEAVITSELGKVGVEAKRLDFDKSYRPRYKAPKYIQFKSDELNQLLVLVQTVRFDIADNGQIKLPKALSNYKICIGNTKYKIGIGGLHSQEKSLCKVSDDEKTMCNADFESYYPFIIINQRLFPKHLGRKFLYVYEKIVKKRLHAKKNGNKVVSDSLKIVINGAFGKFGSKYSKLYSPDLLLATTITGQLTLLMLIEQLELNGIEVVSANTDGVEFYCDREKLPLAETIIFDIELITGYNMDYSTYKGLYAANVNNYVSVADDGTTKAKGIYAETTLSKGRSTPIVYTAIREHLSKNIPLVTTIRQCKDMNEFVAARTVNGGATYNDEFLGKMVRWYYSTNGATIHYATNGNLVPKTGEGNGVVPMMDLIDIPSDLDYQWYIDEAISKLKDLGVSYE